MNLSSPLIGLGGRLRAGKDCVADHLVAEHGFVKLGMSDALHEAMLALDPIIPDPIGDPEVPFLGYADAVKVFGYVEAKRHPEVRRLLQKLGTEVGRNMVGENVWVNIMARKIDDHRGAGHPVVVTGLRFPNEIQMIRELGGQTVWVERPGLEADSTASHASEASVSGDDFGVLIVNDGSLADLNLKADLLVDEIAH